ncbi:MAG TPA: hypothetical protein DF383_12910, partial [Deltaproteobacteria bacterium]|nr:hypothetical protein [Deltaproteobacteria bacterium]
MKVASKGPKILRKGNSSPSPRRNRASVRGSGQRSRAVPAKFSSDPAAQLKRGAQRFSPRGRVSSRRFNPDWYAVFDRFIEDIKSSPHDRELRLIFNDVLEEKGASFLGQTIILAHDAAQNRDNAELSEKLAEAQTIFANRITDSYGLGWIDLEWNEIGLPVKVTIAGHEAVETLFGSP